MFNRIKSSYTKSSKSDTVDYKKLYDILSSKYNHLEQILEEKDKIIERTHAEVSSNVTRDMLSKMINVIDDFEKLHENIDNDIDISIITDAIELIYKNIHNMLKNEMIGVIESSPGKAFNPEIHEAFAYLESEDFDEGYIIEQIRTGYTLEGSLLRAARVIVSKGKPEK